MIHSTTLHWPVARTVSSVTSSRSALLGDAQPTSQQDERLETQDDGKGDHGTDDTRHDPRDSTRGRLARSGRGGAGRAGAGRGRRGRADARAVAASRAPRGLVSDGELVHLRDEGGPADGVLVEVEERVHVHGVRGSRAVRKVEADVDVICRWVRGRRDGGVGEELKGHRRSVVDNPGELVRDSRQLCETKEGQEGSVGAELDADLGGRLAGDGGVELGNNLCGERRASDGADGR